jgi:spoIIIJ-associated protein
VKDRVFSGQDVADALAAAAVSLGLPQADLRYVVLEEGTPGGRGLKPTPARIAVLLQERPEATGEEEEEAAPPPAEDTRTAVRATLRALAEAGGLDLDLEVEEGDEAVVVHLGGKDAPFFHGPDGRGEVLRSVEHLLQKMYGARLQPRALRLACQGFRERRDQALADEARRLAVAVRADGQARTMEPLNAYERRVVHVALQGEPGVKTFSVGEGTARRVTVAPSSLAGDPDTTGDEDAG